MGHACGSDGEVEGRWGCQGEQGWLHQDMTTRGQGSSHGPCAHVADVQSEGEWQGEGSLPRRCVHVADVQCEGEWQGEEGFRWKTCLQLMHIICNFGVLS